MNVLSHQFQTYGKPKTCAVRTMTIIPGKNQRQKKGVVCTQRYVGVFIIMLLRIFFM